MILTAFHGFCMALADSVPGVSGGTIASFWAFTIALSMRSTGCFGAIGSNEKLP